MIVGFFISSQKSLIPKDLDDYFPPEAKKIVHQKAHYTAILYGYGPKFDCEPANDVYSLSAGGVERRNIIVSITDDTIQIDSDWLGSFPCFFSLKYGVVSSHWGMIEHVSKDRDHIGTYILKRYSFIPHGRTVRKNVSKLLAMQRLLINEGVLKLEDVPSSITTHFNSSVDVEKAIKSDIIQAQPLDSNFFIPLSGGYDSRYLACCLRDLKAPNVTTATYSLSVKGFCFESITSQAVAKKLGFDWTIMSIEGYRENEKLIRDWAGGYTHINGDYYEKFANDVLRITPSKKCEQLVVLSGLVGDAFSGKIEVPQDYKSNISKKIVYSHGANVYRWMLTPYEKSISNDAEIELEKYFQARVFEPHDFLIELIRAKIPLLSFLCYSFERRGIPSLAPFTTKSVVTAMLCLSESERKQRRWQVDYFEARNLSEKSLPKKLLKVNSVAIEENSKKYFHDVSSLGLPVYKTFFVRVLLSKFLRNIERVLFLNKFFDVFLRRIGYINSSALISIFRVLK